MKRLFALMLTLSLLLTGGLFAMPAFGEAPEEIHILMDFNIMDGIDSLTDNKYVDYILEKTGVKVVMDNPGPAGFADRVNIVMATGSEMDVIMLSRDQVMRFGLDGILKDLTPYITDAEKYPNVVEYMAPDRWLPVTYDGAVYGFPYSRFDAMHETVFVRKQWLENLNLEIPKTVEDYYDMLYAFTYNDPDQNGVNDTIGLLASSNIYDGGVGEGGRPFREAFDANTYKIIDGVVTPPVIQENYKEFLKFMNRLNNDGLMDTEFSQNIVSVFMDKLKSYKYGMTSYFWHANQLPEYDQGKVHENWVSINPPERVDGSGPSKFTISTYNRNYMGVPTTSTKIDSIMKVWNWVCSPDEGERWLYLGVEGDEYQIDDAGNIEILKQRNSLHWMFSMVSPGILNDNVKKYLELTYPKETVERLELSTADGQFDELAASLPYFPDLANFSIDKIVQEYSVSAILGNVDIDATWDDYVNRYKQGGGQAAMDYWTQWYTENHE